MKANIIIFRREFVWFIKMKYLVESLIKLKTNLKKIIKLQINIKKKYIKLFNICFVL